MQTILVIALFVHVLSAIIAFGPTFTFPFIAAAAGREPMHGNFALRLTERLETRMVMVGWFVQPASGVVMIWAAGFDFFNPSTRWLISAIVLYGIAIALSHFVQNPTVRKMVEMTAHPPAIGSAPAGAAGGAGAAPAGPPPEFVALAKRAQRVGGLLLLMLLVIIYLMVVKPGI
jgi:uncharacterized membrane protein